jgi:lysophospholipase L1-like esterase
MTNCNTYLALGDSYTIGESVTLHESYPYQAVQLARRAGKNLYGPEIIAKTGWTTSELSSHLDHTVLNPPYRVVSLLIGVNNQYRGLSVARYRTEFAELLQTSISLADDRAGQVIVLSIPDWGLSPFGNGSDLKKITTEIAEYNSINREITLSSGCKYVDITTKSPELADDPTMFASDGLHPSGKAYSRWANLLAEQFVRNLQ